MLLKLLDKKSTTTIAFYSLLRLTIAPSSQANYRKTSISY